MAGFAEARLGLCLALQIVVVIAPIVTLNVFGDLLPIGKTNFQLAIQNERQLIDHQASYASALAMERNPRPSETGITRYKRAVAAGMHRSNCAVN
jgi:hypothetical protein